MSDRLEKLYTLTDIENLPEAPVTIEAGGLIKDNQTGRVIARMYLKNCSDKPLSSVLVGFRPKGENGKTISGMRDYLYDASGVPVGEIFGDQTGILFDNNETKSFSADVEGVDFEDGDFWDAAETRKKAEELKLIVPEEKEQTTEAPEAWVKPVEQAKGPEVWENDSHDDETHSAEIYGAAIVEKTFEEPEEEPFEPASLQTRQLEHENKPALEEETDAYRRDQEGAVIELDGPSDEDQPVIELDGPVQETVNPEAAEAAEVEVEPEAAEAEVEPETMETPEEIEPAAEETKVEEPAEAEPEEQPAEEPEAEAEPEEVEEPVEEESVAEPEEEPAPAIPAGPVRLADMYGGMRAGSDLALYADSYGMAEKEEPPVFIEPAAVVAAEPPVEEPVEAPAAEPVAEPEVEPTKPEPPVEAPVVEVPTEVPTAESDAEPAEAESEYAPAKPASAQEPESEIQEPEPEEKRPSIKMDIENPWAGYSADYAPPLGAVAAKEPAAEPAVEPQVEPAPIEAPAVEVPAEEPAAEPQTEEPQTEEPQATESQAEEPKPAEEPEHVPSIEDTIELPKAVAPEKSNEEADTILAAAASKEELSEGEEETVSEEVKATHEKADVVFAEETEVLPSLIDNEKEKALTGEDHSGRNLLNIIVFGGIALVILLVLLIKM